MTTEEADRIWNLPKCERCEAMEARLKACLLANESFARGQTRLQAALAEQAEKTKKAEIALLQALKGQRWMHG